MKTRLTLITAALLACGIAWASEIGQREVEDPGLVGLLPAELVEPAEWPPGDPFLPHYYFTLLGKIAGDHYLHRLGKRSFCFGDVNGDGYDDLIFSSLNDEVWVVLGGSHPDMSPDLVLTVDAPLDGAFGLGLWADDLNDDGYDDVLVADPITKYGGSGGHVFVYHGTPVSSPRVRLPDLTIPAPPGFDGLAFGYALCTADFYADGIPDVVVGCPGRDGNSDSGKVLVLTGPAYTDHEQLYPPFSFAADKLGAALGAGDFNGDGEDEIVAGAWGAGIPPQSGAVYSWNAFGAPGPSRVNLGNRGGWAVSTGDVTADGVVDLAISAYAGSYSRPSKVYISWGHPEWDMSLDQTLEAPEGQLFHHAADSFGLDVSVVGDLTKDGIGDLVVGAPQTGYPKPGYVVIYHGGEGQLVEEPWRIVWGEQDGSRFGWSLSATPGDFNGVAADVAVGAPYFSSDSAEYAGRIYVYGLKNRLQAYPLD